jgi:hypothetical protein
MTPTPALHWMFSEVPLKVRGKYSATQISLAPPKLGESRGEGLSPHIQGRSSPISGTKSPITSGYRIFDVGCRMSDIRSDAHSKEGLKARPVRAPAKGPGTFRQLSAGPVRAPQPTREFDTHVITNPEKEGKKGRMQGTKNQNPGAQSCTRLTAFTQHRGNHNPLARNTTQKHSTLFQPVRGERSPTVPRSEFPTPRLKILPNEPKSRAPLSLQPQSLARNMYQTAAKNEPISKNIVAPSKSLGNWTLVVECWMFDVFWSSSLTLHPLT